MPISVEKAVIAKITKSGERFEILVDPELALQFKSGKDVDMDELIVTKEIYENSKKGLRASEDKVNKAFGTNDIIKITKAIILHGDVQLTTEQRHEMLEQKRKAIANIISRQGVNPQTGQPNPPERVLRAMEEAKSKIDVFKKPEEQIEEILKSIQSILPINFEKVKISVLVPAQFAGKISNAVRGFGPINNEKWGQDGSYSCRIELSAGLQQDLFDKINSITHGQGEIKVIK